MPTRFPSGLQAPFFSGGVPSSDILSPFPQLNAAKTFFVHSGTGSDGNDGLSPEAPLASLAQAHSLVTSGNGDVIYLLEGHSETYASAAAISLTKSGFSIIGIGLGTRRPIFYAITATTATFAISGSDILIRNVVFDAATHASAVDAVAVMVNVTAGTGLVLDGCRWIMSVTGGSIIALIGITFSATATRYHITGCRCHTPVLNATEWIRITGAASAVTRVILENNYAFGKFLTSAVNNITSGVRDLEAIGNRIVNTISKANGAGLAMALHASTTGHVSYNSGQAGAGTSVSKNGAITGTGCTYAQNYFANLVNETGGLLKAVST